MTKEKLFEFGYQAARQLPTGEWAGCMRMLFTVGLFVGIDEDSYRTRFCYPDMIHAAGALQWWDGVGDPPGPWIKEKGAPGGDRNNPATFKGITIIEEAAEIDPAAWARL